MSLEASSSSSWDQFFAKYDPKASITGSAKVPRKASSMRDLNASTKKAARRTESDREACMEQLRRLVLMEGVPEDERMTTSKSSPRSLIWKLLLDVRTVDPSLYLSLLAKGPSPMHDKVQNDAFRTLATDDDFKSRVDEASLIRVLDAFVWHYMETNPMTKGGKNEIAFGYVQGMNVLLAPFLYVMPSELEAFHSFCQFIEVCCPTYVQPSLAGVHKGLKLLDQCLQMADLTLFDHLKTKGLTAELYGFPSVMTLCAATPSLQQLLQIWDYFLSFGTHLSILCIVAQLLFIRDDLLAAPHPMKILRQFPELDAKRIIGVATTLVRDLPDALYDDLVRHTIEL